MKHIPLIGSLLLLFSLVVPLCSVAQESETPTRVTILVDAFSETPELSLVIDTADGQIVTVGCSHPGIEQILESVQAKSRSVRLLVGGLHWVSLPDDEVERLSRTLRDDWNVQAIAPGHCTGEIGFAILSRVFVQRYVYAGLGVTFDVGFSFGGAIECLLIIFF